MLAATLNTFSGNDSCEWNGMPDVRHDLIADLSRIEAVAAELPSWDGTAKIRGKIAALRGTIAHADAPQLREILSEVAALEDAVQRLLAIDPLTRLLESLAALRARVQGLVRAEPS